jgi:hypothetical protein
VGVTKTTTYLKITMRFWKKEAVKKYLIQDIFDIDEVVRKYGGCQNDEDYKIQRSYYCWEWQGDENWITIPVEQEEYEKHKDNEDLHYRSELNYEAFLGKFWMDEFESFLAGKHIIFSENDFSKAVEKSFFKLKFEGQAKYFLKEIIEGLEYLIRALDRISNYKFEIHRIEVNSIQQLVIETYKESYASSIKGILEAYKFIYPEIINYPGQFAKKSDAIVTSDEKKLWYRIGILIADGTIQFVKGQDGINIHYDGNIFTSGTSIAKKLSEKWGLKKDSIKSYINDTMNDNRDVNRKNIFISLQKTQSLMLYCSQNKIQPSNYLLEKYKHLKNK